MDPSRFIQPGFALGLILVTFAVMFVPIPQGNMDVFKTLITAIISFISGTVVAVAAMNHTKKEDKDGESFIKKDSSSPGGDAAP